MHIFFKYIQCNHTTKLAKLLVTGFEQWNDTIRLNSRLVA